MKQLKVAVSAGLEDVFESIHEQVPVKGADWMEVSAVVLSSEDLRAGKLEEVQSLHLGIPVFAVSDDPSQLPVGQLYGVMDTNPTNKAFYGRQVDNAAQKYEEQLLPPFFGSLEKYVQAGKNDYGSGKERKLGSCSLPEISVQNNSQEKRLLIWVY